MKPTKRGWMVINVTKGTFDGYYADEESALRVAEALEECYPGEGIIVAKPAHESAARVGLESTGHPRCFSFPRPS